MKKLESSYQNPIVLRSKKLLTDAFFDLLRQNPSRKIKISDLCRQAGVARPTFYSHFDTIEDIPLDYLAGWKTELPEWIAARMQENLSDEAFVLEICIASFTYWGEHAETYKLLKAAGLGRVVSEAMSRENEILGKTVFTITERVSDPDLQDFILSQMGNTFYNLYNFWVTTGMKQPPEQIARIAAIFVSPQIADAVNAELHAQQGKLPKQVVDTGAKG